MDRRQAICGMLTTVAAVPLAAQAANEITNWTEWWERSSKYTLAIADAMPAADYSFAPFGTGAPDGVKTGDGARTFGQVMQHIAQAERGYLGRFEKGPSPTPPENDTSKAATLKFLNEVFVWSIGVVRQLTPADLTKTFSGGRGPMTGLDLLLNAMVHTAHTRGYSDMYLRNKGIKPPTYQV